MSQIDECVNSNMSYTRLARFLLFASPEGTYLPGLRMKPTTYLGENLAALRVLLNDVELSTVFETIEWILSNKLNVHEEIIPLVLSECCKIANWRTPSLEFSLKAIRTGREFLIFNKFCFEILPSIGTSEEVLEFIDDWYLVHHYEEVADMVLKTPTLYGWRHGDIMKIASLRSDYPARAAVYAFAIKGLEEMNKEFMYIAEARKMVSLFNRVANYGQVTDPQIAADEMAFNLHSMSHVNPSLRNNKQVWIEAIPQMNLIELMDKFKSIIAKGLLRCPFANTWDPYFVTHLCDRFESLGAVLESKIHPARSFLEHQRFQNEAKIKQQYAIQNRTKNFPLGRRNRRITYALEYQMETALNENIKSVGIDISVMIDKTNLIGDCSFRAYVSAHKAAALIASCLKKTGDKVDIVTMDGAKEINLVSDKTKTVFSMAQTIREIYATTCSFNVKKYLNEKASKKDLIVVIGARINHEIYMDIVDQHSNNPRQTKFVFCSLKGTNKPKKTIDHEKVLLTSGFDEKLITLITAFGMKPKW